MTRVLVTGAGGFVAHHVLEHLLVNTDWGIVATDSFRHQGKTDRIAEVLAGQPRWAGRVEVITHDLTAPFSAQMAQRIGDITYLIAAASDRHTSPAALKAARSRISSWIPVTVRCEVVRCRRLMAPSGSAGVAR